MTPVLPMPDPALRDEELRDAASVLIQRYQFLRQAGITFGGDRDLYSIFGYDRQITARMYRERYMRGGIAKRIVEAFPKATWRGGFELIEDEDPEHLTEFEKAWEELEERLNITNVLLRADILAGLSTFSAVLLGTTKGELDQEITKGKPDDLIYLTPFSGGGGPANGHRLMIADLDVDCMVRDYDIDITSKRFGLPAFYQIRRTDIAVPSLMKPVHYSRILHLAEGTLDDEVFGPPTLEACWNLLDDLDKVSGGGAEAFFQRANQGMHLNIEKGAELSKDTLDKLKESVEEYKNNVTRILRTREVEVKMLGSDVANFNQPADAILTQIAGCKSIPKRILTGSEMGELASSQDRDNWKDQINGRQTGYAEPKIVRPLIDRLIEYGYLPEPKDYDVKWAHMQTLTEQEKSEGAVKWATVNQTYGRPVFTDSEIRDKWYEMAPLTPEQMTEATPAPPVMPGVPGAPGAPGAGAPGAATDPTAAAGDAISQLLDGGAQPKTLGGVGSGVKYHTTAQEVVNTAFAANVDKAKGQAVVVHSDAISARKTVDFIGSTLKQRGFTLQGKGEGWDRTYTMKNGISVHVKIGTDFSVSMKVTKPVYNKAREKHYQKLEQALLDRRKLGDDTMSRDTPEGKQFYTADDELTQLYADWKAEKEAAVNLKRDKVFSKANKIRYAEGHDFASTQVNLDGDLADRVRAFAEAIPDGELADDGREDTPHVTIKYGLHDDDPTAVEDLLADESPITLTLGPVKTFQPEGEDYDVVFISVKSPDLKRLNTKISDGVEVTDTWPTYRPHITLAYVKRGAGEVYEGDKTFDGETVVLDTVVFSPTEGETTDILLRAAMAVESEAEILRVLADAVRVNNIDVIDEILGIRHLGDVSGHTFHGNQYTGSQFDAMRIPWESRANPTAEQTQKLFDAYTTIDRLLSDPDIGPQLWSTLSSFTPGGLKDRIDRILSGGIGPIYGGKGVPYTDPLLHNIKYHPTLKVGAGSSDLRPALETISSLINEEPLVEQMLEAAIAQGDWQTFSKIVTGKIRHAGGSGSGNFNHAGRPGEVGGSSSEGGHAPWQSAGGFEHTGIIWKQPVDANGRPIPIKADTVEEAAALVLDGKVVEVKDVGSAFTLINRLAEMANEAKAAGKAAKDYDLCQVSVAGSNMFCADSLKNVRVGSKIYKDGVPRLEMPQLGGKPVPGSEADKLPRNPWDKSEVDGSKQFVTFLQGLGVKTSHEVVPAASLKASQREMIGSKVAGIMRDTTFDPAKNPVFVSSDNYVVDGHHRWAAVVGRDAADGRLGDSAMNIIRVNAPISMVLHIANQWSEKFGIQQAAGVVKQAKETGLVK